MSGKKVDWESREGVLLSDGLRLSPAAQRFAIARELWHVRGSQVWQDGGIGATALFATYLLGSAISRRLGFTERPRVSGSEAGWRCVGLCVMTAVGQRLTSLSSRYMYL